MMPPFPGIEFRHLRYFLAASDHGSFRRVSLILGIQQSAINRRIRDLEDRLGASLFQRSSGSIRLTLAGERFQTHARSVWDNIQKGKNEISAIRSGAEGQMRVGLTAPIAGGILHDLLTDFSRQCPSVYIGLVGGAPAAHIEALSRLDLDIAFLAGSQTWYGCEGAVLWSERVYAYLADLHPLAERAELTWTDLQGETIIVPDDALG
ncbi:DNA-binding transcriptional LysR family regulator [Sphingomonas endophytica]|uniref:DNA-binding transcriptional LysR family regulator n=1 Tax=Sphingomonas endophytica TaxID=869719 RepID=A0A7X0MN13_9SPHN|nr:LysR family transcriptional regulator [Sphingomonas endophytica]MBB6505217.1 DNA-binding transcriptional LysR family regulator [Sphingomonas endophytica]